ncbi:hypothetical protein SLEP1_g43158 [Rubroshorea leprosula]|uniref:Uncharacterized protein n=1 Tax=Rubroshorea leprosula TaxID=152421 RepID=A0AAV5LCM6_9ROSI|nr:hypothetical protein SLEP1_g43158 [Rubroshorea leprosula]
MPRNSNPHSSRRTGEKSRAYLEFPAEGGISGFKNKKRRRKSQAWSPIFSKNESVARGAWGGLSGGRVEKKKKMRTSKTRG